jgi:iron complex transport system substrate-binding protein
MSQRKMRFTALLLLMVPVLMSSACAATTTAKPSPVPITMPPTQTAVPTWAGVKLMDAAGQAVELKTVPERLVVVGRGPYMALHLLYMFPAAWERLVGLEKKGLTADDFLPLIDPNWESKTVLASNPNAEQIAALQPDLVLIKGIVQDSLGKALAQVNIPTLYLNLETPDAFYQDVINVGTALGEESRAQEIITYYEDSVGHIQQRVAGLSESEKPRVLLLEYTDRGGTFAVNVPAKSWIQTIQLQIAGGNPVYLQAAAESDGWTVTNLEQIALWNPDKIFVAIAYTLDPQEVIARLKADPLWSQLKATRNNELYVFPSDLYQWNTPGPRWILGVKWLATRIHPDRFADLDMKAEIYQFFEYFYGMDQAAVDAGIMPKVQMDVR